MLSHQHSHSSSSCATIRVSSSHLHLHLHLHPHPHPHPYGSAFFARHPPEALQYQIPKALHFLLMAKTRPYHHSPYFLSLTQSRIEASPSNESSPSPSPSSPSRKQGHHHRSYRIQRTITTSDNAAVDTNAIGIAPNSNGVINKDVSSIPGIIYPPATTVGKSTNIVWQTCMVKKAERQKLIGQKGCVVWITGLSGSGKSTLACAFEHALMDRGKLSYILDGDNLRHGLNNNLGFSAEDRTENIRRVGEVAKLFVDAGIICIASLISPYRKDRDACRKLLEEGEFIEVYMNFPLELCEERDPKGLYKLARAGKIRGFTGIDDPYEPPSNCEIVMEPTVEGRCPTPSEMAEQLISYLEERFFFAPPP